MVRLPINRGAPETKLWMEILKAFLQDIKPKHNKTGVVYYDPITFNHDINGDGITYACDVLDIPHCRFKTICEDIRIGKREIKLFNYS